jgi:hypothetical protein
MTRQLADGVALADDPANGLSFGQSRCRAVAAGIARAVDEGVTDVPGATAVVLGALPAHGVSRDRPYERWPHGSPASRWRW